MQPREGQQKPMSVLSFSCFRCTLNNIIHSLSFPTSVVRDTSFISSRPYASLHTYTQPTTHQGTELELTTHLYSLLLSVYTVPSSLVLMSKCMKIKVLSPWPRLVAWIQISLNSCDTLRRQNVAHTFCPHVWHALATCRCNKSVNKPLAGLPCDCRPWGKGLGTCRGDKSPRVTGP